MEKNLKDPIDASDAKTVDVVDARDVGDAQDVIDSADIEALRSEILHLRDSVAGAATHEAVLDDRVRELEQQVEELAVAIERLSRLTSSPAVRALLAATRPARHYLERRHARS